MTGRPERTQAARSRRTASHAAAGVVSCTEHNSKGKTVQGAGSKEHRARSKSFPLTVSVLS